MESIESKTSVIIDIFFCVVFMPLLVFLGPSHTWMSQWPIFFSLVCLFLYISYFFLIVDQYIGSDPPEAMGSHSPVIVVYGGLQLPVVAIPVTGDGFRYAGAEPLSDGVA